MHTHEIRCSQQNVCRKVGMKLTPNVMDEKTTIFLINDYKSQKSTSKKHHKNDISHHKYDISLVK